MSALLPFPTINGVRYEFASIALLLSGVSSPIVGIKDISFNEKMRSGKVYGANVQRLGTTRGRYESEGSVTLYLEDLQAFLYAITGGNPLLGYLEQRFDLVVNYEEGLNLSVVNLVRCKIEEVDDSHSEGVEGLTAKLALDIQSVQRDTLLPVTQMIL